VKNIFKILMFSAGLVSGFNVFAAEFAAAGDELVPQAIDNTRALVAQDQAPDSLPALVPYIELALVTSIKAEPKTEEASHVGKPILTEKEFKTEVERVVSQNMLNPVNYGRLLMAAVGFKSNLAILRLNSAAADEQKKDQGDNSYDSLYPFSHLVALSVCAKNNDTELAEIFLSLWNRPFMNEISKATGPLPEKHLLASFSTGENNPFFSAVTHNSIDVFKSLFYHIFNYSSDRDLLGKIVCYTTWIQDLFFFIIEKDNFEFFTSITDTYLAGISHTSCYIRDSMRINCTDIAWRLAMHEKYEMFDYFDKMIVPTVPPHDEHLTLRKQVSNAKKKIEENKQKG
jgi:hypothetical protein